MNQKQNIIFMIGVILMIMVFWVNGYWSILRSGLTKPAVNPLSPVAPVKGKCPPGYSKVGNRCIPPVSSIPKFFG